MPTLRVGVTYRCVGVWRCLFSICIAHAFFVIVHIDNGSVFLKAKLPYV